MYLSFAAGTRSGLMLSLRRGPVNRRGSERAEPGTGLRLLVRFAQQVVEALRHAVVLGVLSGE